MEVEVEIPPFSKVAVSIKMTQKKTQLKYTATQCTLFVDGTKKCAPTEGYRLNISSESAVVDYGRFQDGSKYYQTSNISQKERTALVARACSCVKEKKILRFHKV